MRIWQIAEELLQTAQDLGKDFPRIGEAKERYCLKLEGVPRTGSRGKAHLRIAKSQGLQETIRPLKQYLPENSL